MRRRTVPSGSGPSTIRARSAGSVRAHVRATGRYAVPMSGKGTVSTCSAGPPGRVPTENRIRWRRPDLLQRETMNAAPEPPLVPQVGILLDSGLRTIPEGSGLPRPEEASSSPSIATASGRIGGARATATHVSTQRRNRRRASRSAQLSWREDCGSAAASARSDRPKSRASSSKGICSEQGMDTVLPVARSSASVVHFGSRAGSASRATTLTFGSGRLRMASPSTPQKPTACQKIAPIRKPPKPQASNAARPAKRPLPETSRTRSLSRGGAPSAERRPWPALSADEGPLIRI